MSNLTQDNTQTCPAFVWMGDLEDDCWCQQGEYFAHAELMAAENLFLDDDGDRQPVELWWFSVSRNGQEIFNSSDHQGEIIGGALCRALAEAVMGNAKDQ